MTRAPNRSQAICHSQQAKPGRSKFKIPSGIQKESELLNRVRCVNKVGVPNAYFIVPNPS